MIKARIDYMLFCTGGQSYLLRFFKPNVEKMAKRRDVEGLTRLLKPPEDSSNLSDTQNLRMEAISALAQLRDSKAVEPLVEALNDSNEQIQILAASALGSIGDKRAVEPLIQALTTGFGGSSFDSVKRALVSIGDAESLIRALKDSPNQHAQDRLALTLGSLGDRKAVEPIINWLFEPRQLGLIIADRYSFEDRFIERTYNPFDSTTRTWVTNLHSLLDGYDQIILEIATGVEKYVWAEMTQTTCKLDLAVSNNAIKKLCDIQTQVASNILCRVVLREDATLEFKGMQSKRGKDGTSYWEHTTEARTLRFWRQRKMAEEELKRRGNPGLDSSAYLKKEAW